MPTITFDLAKNDLNRRKHGMDLGEAEGFDWDNAVVREDRSEAYGEARFLAVGFIGIKLCTLIFTMTSDGDTVRAISLRKATKAEEREWSGP